MLNVEVNGITYNLPQSFKEIKFGKYLDILKIKEPNRIRNGAKVLATLWGIDENELLKMDYISFEKLCGVLSFLSELSCIEKNTEDVITVGEYEFKIKSDFVKLSAGDMSDIDITSENKDEIDIQSSILTTLLKCEQLPIYEQRKQYLEDNIDSHTALSIVLFFLNIVEGLVNNISTYLEVPVME